MSDWKVGDSVVFDGKNGTEKERSEAWHWLGPYFYRIASVDVRKGAAYIGLKDATTCEGSPIPPNLTFNSVLFHRSTITDYLGEAITLAVMFGIPVIWLIGIVLNW